MRSPLLYRCPPHDAWIPIRQCGYNARRGEASRKAKPGSDARLAGLEYRDTCKHCPGVVRLSEANGTPPRTAAQVAGQREKRTKRKRPHKRHNYSQPRPRVATQEGRQVSTSVWKRKMLTGHIVKAALRQLGVSLENFDETYRAVANRDGGKRMAPPSREEIKAVEAYQRTGDIKALRAALNGNYAKAASAVVRVTAHQAQQREGRAA